MSEQVLRTYVLRGDDVVERHGPLRLYSFPNAGTWVACEPSAAPVMTKTKEAKVSSTIELEARLRGFSDVTEMRLSDEWGRRCGTPVQRPSEAEIRRYAEEQDELEALLHERDAAERRYREQETARAEDEERLFVEATRRMFPEVSIR